MEDRKKRSLGQELAIELGGDVFGMGAGVLVGGIALAVVDNIPGIGKPLKLLVKLGAYGLEIATALTVRDKSQEYLGAAFDCVNDVRKLFAPKPQAVEAHDVEAEVEVK